MGVEAVKKALLDVWSGAGFADTERCAPRSTRQFQPTDQGEHAVQGLAAKQAIVLAQSGARQKLGHDCDLFEKFWRKLAGENPFGGFPRIEEFSSDKIAGRAAQSLLDRAGAGACG
jgi:hypothetical protein